MNNLIVKIYIFFLNGSVDTCVYIGWEYIENKIKLNDNIINTHVVDKITFEITKL